MPIEGKHVPNAFRTHDHEAAGIDEAEVLVGELPQQAKCARLMIRLYEDPFSGRRLSSSRSRKRTAAACPQVTRRSV
jgi:hypothetical protein